MVPSQCFPISRLVLLTNIVSNRHIHAILSAHERVLVNTISKPLTSTLNQLGAPTLASLQRVYLTSQLETIIRENLNTSFGNGVQFDEDIAPALRGLLLYSRFARRDAVFRASGKTPREAPYYVTDWRPVTPGDWDLLPRMTWNDFRDWFQARTSIADGLQVVVEGLSARTEVEAAGSVWDRFRQTVMAAWISRHMNR